MSAAPGSLAWFAAHEARLAWRDWVAAMTGGRRGRAIGLLVFTLLAIPGLHLLAYGVLSPALAAGIGPEPGTLMVLTGVGVMLVSAMISQALVAITRAYYARADLDLILSSPAPAERVFAVRTGTILVSSMALAALLAAPAIDVLAILAGPHWLAAFPVLMALAALSTALALLIAMGLFRTIGPKRTRLVAQILAGLIGAGVVIGIQAAAILGTSDILRLDALGSGAILAAAPPPESPLFIPARAAMGDPAPLLLVLLLGALGFAGALGLTATGFASLATATAGAGGETAGKAVRAPARFRSGGARAVLRAKEWRLLLRDPWLISQSLMQLLYLVPPALLLGVNHGGEIGVLVVVVPVIVMAAGQLSGGLSWLALSGEDAPDLIATAPVPRRAVLLAKIEAVLGLIAIPFAPLLVGVALADLRAGMIALASAVIAVVSSSLIQLWFRAPSRRALFRRRQNASRIATTCEALVSVMWAGTGALWLAGTVLAVLPAILALLVLGIARLLAPRQPRGERA